MTFPVGPGDRSYRPRLALPIARPADTPRRSQPPHDPPDNRLENAAPGGAADLAPASGRR